MPPRRQTSLSLSSFVFLLLLSVFLGAYYRVPVLSKRPMHTDEAILATKSAEFWTTGEFDYDPTDYHGPGLHYATKFIGTLAGWGGPETWSDTQVRVIAVVCGMLVILLTLLASDALGRFGTVVAMLLTAVSPMMVYYSRYYIMEILLVLLVAISLVSLWRYTQSGKRGWLVLAGCAFGLQHATKETFVINLGAIVCGWIAARVVVGGFEKRSTGLSLGSPRNTRPNHPLFWVLIPAILVSVAAFSGGFHNWDAVKESVTTYANYLQRSEGSGHEKPWYYYIGLIFYHKDTILWTEALIGGLGIVGLVHGFFGRHSNTSRQAAVVFLGIYTLAQFTVYSILAYKTPWSILSAQHGLIVLAGAGAGALWNAFTGGIARMILRVLIGLGVYHLCSQSMLVIDRYRADSRNPYVYEHTSTHLMELVHRVRKFAAMEGSDFSAQVINADAGWPLPWYWRNIPNIGYHTTMPTKLSGSVLIFDAELQAAVRTRLRGKRYNEGSYYGQRPNRTLMVFVEQSLWEKFMAGQASNSTQATENE